VGEKCFVYYNGTDYVKVSSSVADGVTSVGGTGTVNGISLSGTVTSTGNLTLGGALTGVSLTSQVSGILPVANGGTATATPALVAGSGVTISGTWPNQTINATGTGGTVTSVTGSGNIASSGGNTPNITFTGTLPVSSGGTGASTLTANNVLLGNGTSALQVVAPSTAGNILTSNGTSWVSSTPSTGGATGRILIMPANTSPIFPLTPDVGAMNAIVSTAMTNTKAMDGTEAVGTSMVLAFTAGANGSRIDSIIVRYTATNGSTATGTSAASVIRLWVNNGAANTTATTQPQVFQLPVDGYSLPASYRIYAGNTVAAGGVLAFQISVTGGDY
jgi:hypothetical protein